MVNNFFLFKKIKISFVILFSLQTLPQAFGAPLSNLQTIKHRLATLKTEITIGRTFADRCIELLSEKKLDTATASMAKYWLTDLQGKVSISCAIRGLWWCVCFIERVFIPCRVHP